MKSLVLSQASAYASLGRHLSCLCQYDQAAFSSTGRRNLEIMLLRGIPVTASYLFEFRIAYKRPSDRVTGFLSQIYAVFVITYGSR